MKKYFYSDGTNSFGPFTLEELRSKNISRETLVWFKELGDWKPAGTVPEISEIFQLSPPPVSNAGSISGNAAGLNSQKPPKSWLVESILVTVFCCLPFGIAGIVNAAKVESRFYSGDVQGAVKSSEDAKKWVTLGFWIGMVVSVIYIIVVIYSGINEF